VLRGVRKTFGSHVAVNSLDLTVSRGEVFGLLGPNGAGKTTVIKMMLGLVRPTAGTVELLGRPATDPAARASVGFLPEQFRFHEWLTAREFLDFHGQLYGLSREDRRARIPLALDRVGLAHREHSQLRTFSKGMLQRIGLAQAVLNDPLLLVLDEPTSGLDPVGRREVRDLIVELRAQGVTVLLNSHILSEIERVCDEVAILDLGKMVWQGRMNELAADERIEVTVELSELSEEALDAVRRIAADVTEDGGNLRFTASSAIVVSDVVASLARHGARVYAVRPERPSLEDLFVKLVEGRDV
jgi:ABC-2 type transport system ATP-binding protein